MALPVRSLLPWAGVLMGRLHPLLLCDAVCNTQSLVQWAVVNPKDNDAITVTSFEE